MIGSMSCVHLVLLDDRRSGAAASRVRALEDEVVDNPRPCNVPVVQHLAPFKGDACDVASTDLKSAGLGLVLSNPSCCC